MYGPRIIRTGLLLTASAMCLLVLPRPSRVQASVDNPAKHLIEAMLANEKAASQYRSEYSYISQERSDRTGGHLWTEKVVETPTGKIRFLLTEDGRPISPDRMAQERGRLARYAADPAALAKATQASKDDEAHALQLLEMVPRAFLFSNMREQGGNIHIDFAHDPNYDPQSMEERVLHNMVGTVVIDGKEMRLHHIEGRLPQDVSLGFGLLATIRAGSTFGSTRNPIDPPDWKTASINTDVSGHALFFKTISRKEHAEHSDFHRLPDQISVSQAVALAEQP